METGIRMKTAIFGGTFDPLHRGHIELLRNIYDELCPDRMMIIPAGHPYLKENEGKNVTPSRVRLEMLRIGLEELDMPYEISLVEMENEGPSYSVDTIRKIKTDDSRLGNGFAEGEYFFLCGSDVLFSVEKWHEAKSFLSEVVLAVVPRGTDDTDLILEKKKELEENMNAKVYISCFRGKEISSSMIRKDPEANKNLLSEKVFEYIAGHNLYGM